jgi:hypothetical protein
MPRIPGRPPDRREIAALLVRETRAAPERSVLVATGWEGAEACAGRPVATGWEGAMLGDEARDRLPVPGVLDCSAQFSSCTHCARDSLPSSRAPSQEQWPAAPQAYSHPPLLSPSPWPVVSK